MQETQTAMWVVNKLQREVSQSIREAKNEQRFFWKNVEAQGKIKALNDVYRQLVLMELTLEEEAKRLRQAVDVYGNPIQEPHLIDL